jgi:hypothetical protein
LIAHAFRLTALIVFDTSFSSSIAFRRFILTAFLHLFFALSPLIRFRFSLASSISILSICFLFIYFRASLLFRATPQLSRLRHCLQLIFAIDNSHYFHIAIYADAFFGQIIFAAQHFAMATSSPPGLISRLFRRAAIAIS